MWLEKSRRRLRLVLYGLSVLRAMYRREGSVLKIVGRLWFVTTREGLGGLKARLPVPTRAQERVLQLAPERAPDPALSYQAWSARFDSLRPEDVEAARQHLAGLDLPSLLILLIVTADSLPALGRIAASWQGSIHPGWQAKVVLPQALAKAGAAALRDILAAEPRITLLDGASGIVAARAGFPHTLLCYGGVLLNSLSAYMLLEAASRTGADIVYADNDVIAPDGSRSDPAFKPQFSPTYLSHTNYIGDCLLVSSAVALPDGLGALTLAGFDHLVASIATGRRVEHLPFILSHHQPAGPRPPHGQPDIPDHGPSVALIIPTRDGVAHLRACVDSILARTAYDLSTVEIIVVDNGSSEAETLEYLDELVQRARFSVLRYPHPFNFAEINNLGAAAARQDILVFLNNDTVVLDPAWLGKLVFHASQPGVGVVGAKLLYPDGTIQHAGCVAGGSRGTVQHLLHEADPAEVGPIDRTREIALVTGACMAVRRTVFNQVGGFDPVLRITWNDAKLCLDVLAAGYRNIYVADPLLEHDESKTREKDNTKAHMERYFSEANYTRRRFRDYFYDDPSYSPNLSVEQAGELAEPPRVRRPWHDPHRAPSCILLLSMTYKVGFGVPLVIQQHAAKLVALGHQVIVGGPATERDFAFPGCERVEFHSVRDAACFAFQRGVALVIAHTPPFFELPILIGAHIPVLAYDYGEPPAHLFPEPVRAYLDNVEYQKRAAAGLTTAIATISQAVKDETWNSDAVVAGLANSHLPSWSESLRPQRDAVRDAHGWQDRFVVLTVCRFGENERVYKGLDKLAQILRGFPYLCPERAGSLVWVLAGAGSEKDVEQAEQLGFTVFANVSDAMLAGLYTAADAYMGFSRWEGYDLGISQALAMGLPTIGSDIPAHREFPIVTSDSPLVVCTWLQQHLADRDAGTRDRTPIIYDWDSSTTAFCALAQALLDRPAPQRPVFGSRSAA